MSILDAAQLLSKRPPSLGGLHEQVHVRPAILGQQLVDTVQVDPFRVEPIAPWLGGWIGIVHLGVQSGKISPHEVETLTRR